MKKPYLLDALFIAILAIFTLDACHRRTPRPVIVAEAQDTILVADTLSATLKASSQKELKLPTYRISMNGRVLNVLNIFNLAPYAKELTQPIMNDLAINGFAIVPDSTATLLGLYRQNDTLGLPNFVTTDVALDLANLYDVYLQRTVEEQFLAPLLADVCLSLHRASLIQAGREKTYAEAARRNAMFFAVPYMLLTGKSLNMDDDYMVKIEQELAYIDQQTDHGSSLWPQNGDFAYSDIQPAGYYTRSATLRRYCKALTWLQAMPCCLDDATQRQQAVLLAMLLNGDSKLLAKYNKLLNVISFLKGQQASVSMAALSSWMQKSKIRKPAEALRNADLKKMTAYLNEQRENLPEPPKVAVCAKSVFFIPPSFRADEVILGQMTDAATTSKRPFPKVLDIYAAFGSSLATNYLLGTLREDSIWADYPSRLTAVGQLVQEHAHNSRCLPDQRMETLLTLLNLPQDTLLTANRAWQMKAIITAEASWLPTTKWPAGTPPPQMSLVSSHLNIETQGGWAIPVVSVEPNLPFWNSLLAQIHFTEQRLQKLQVMTPALKQRTTVFIDILQMLAATAERQAAHTPQDKDFNTKTAYITGQMESLAHAMQEIPVNTGVISSTAQQPANEVRVFERRDKKSANSVMYASVEPVCRLYVLVEADGKVFLARGGTFSYNSMFK